MKHIALSEIKDDLSRFLREAESEQIVITRHGRPAGLLVGFASEDDWFDYRLEHDPRFLDRIDRARASIKAGRGVKLEAVTLALESTEIIHTVPQQNAPDPTRIPPKRRRRASRTVRNQVKP